MFDGCLKSHPCIWCVLYLHLILDYKISTYLSSLRLVYKYDAVYLKKKKKGGKTNGHVLWLIIRGLTFHGQLSTYLNIILTCIKIHQ
jgi:hypothetical protein